MAEKQQNGGKHRAIVLIRTDSCSRGWPVLLYQCFPDFYERISCVGVGRVAQCDYMLAARSRLSVVDLVSSH